MATNANAPVFQANATDGTPAVGFSLYSYAAGTTTPIATYQDSLAVTINTNPIILDSYGMAKVWITVATKLVLKDLDAATVFTVDNIQAQAADIFDSNGKYLVKFTGVTDAIDYLTITNAAAAGTVIIGVDGLDVNIPLTLSGKGTGRILLGSATSAGVELLGDQPIQDSSAKSYLSFTKIASSVNNVNITNASIGTNPVVSAVGTDTNIGLDLQVKGTGSYGLKGTATQRGQLDLYEQTSNGTNKITFRTPAAITTNHALTFDGGGTDRVLTFGGDLTTGGAFTTTSTFSQTGAYSATAAVSFTGAVTTAGAFTTAGANSLTLTTTGTTNSTLPLGTKTLVPNDLTITAGGLLTGGGDLSTNRTLTAPAATNAESATGTSTAVIMTPGTMIYHPSTAKAWVNFSSSGSTTITSSYNVASLTDGGTGLTTINFSTNFADTNYCSVGMSFIATFMGFQNAVQNVGSVLVECFNTSGAASDQPRQCVAIFGVLA